MDRRSYLGALGGAGATGLAGCLDDGLGGVLALGDGDTALDSPEVPRGDPTHPIHGDEFPTFSLPDPLADREISLEEFEGERSYLLTFIYTSCTEECGTLLQLLRLVQDDAVEEGYEDDVAFLAMTFDPETDGPEELREYGNHYGADVDADNWHFLRPETTEEALSLINDEIGVPVDVGGDEHDGDESSDEDGTDGDTETDGPDHDHGTSAIHYYIVFLVNEHGIVERSYPNVTDSREETRPQSIIEDVRTVVE